MGEVSVEASSVISVSSLSMQSKHIHPHPKLGAGPKEKQNQNIFPYVLFYLRDVSGLSALRGEVYKIKHKEQNSGRSRPFFYMLYLLCTQNCTLTEV